MGGEIELMRKKYCTMRGRGQVGKGRARPEVN